MRACCQGIFCVLVQSIVSRKLSFFVLVLWQCGHLQVRSFVGTVTEFPQYGHKPFCASLNCSTPARIIIALTASPMIPRGRKNKQNKRPPRVATIPKMHRNKPYPREGVFSVSGVRLICGCFPYSVATMRTGPRRIGNLFATFGARYECHIDCISFFVSFVFCLHYKEESNLLYLLEGKERAALRIARKPEHQENLTPN